MRFLLGADPQILASNYLTEEFLKDVGALALIQYNRTLVTFVNQPSLILLRHSSALVGNSDAIGST